MAARACRVCHHSRSRAQRSRVRVIVGTLSPLCGKRFSPPPECLRSGRLQGLILNAICVPPTRAKVLAADDAGAMSHDCLTIRATKELPTKSVLLCKCFSCSMRYLSPTQRYFAFSQYHYQRDGRLATLFKCLVMAVGGVAVINKLQPLLGLDWF
jgi:hypothetical protein